jgi:chromate transporter
MKGVRPSLASLFFSFLAISATTIGGGYAMVPVICDAVTRRGWLDEREFWDLFARAQSVPGPFGLNIALAIGRDARGAAGFAVSGLAIVIPPFVALVAAGALLSAFGSLPQVADFMEGARATIPGFVLAMILKMAKARRWNAFRATATVALAAVFIAFPALAIPVFFGATLALYFAERAWNS